MRRRPAHARAGYSMEVKSAAKYSPQAIKINKSTAYIVHSPGDNVHSPLQILPWTVLWQCSTARKNALYRCLFHRHWRPVCRGCKRFAHEVIDWNSYSRNRSGSSMRACPGFCPSASATNCRLLTRPCCAGSSRCSKSSLPRITTSTAGSTACSRREPARSTVPWTSVLKWTCLIGTLPLTELRDVIDQEFYTLSEAHYERYMLTPDLFSAGAR